MKVIKGGLEISLLDGLVFPPRENPHQKITVLISNSHSFMKETDLNSTFLTVKEKLCV